MSKITRWRNCMNIWKDEEVKALFEEVESCKMEQNSLKLAFKRHAERFGRKQNSVRNYYYHEVDNLKNDKKRLQKLGINLQEHIKNHFVGFDKVQEEDLFENIEKLVGQGMSVRSACLKLSNGDLTVMTRYQNKYQNMRRKVETVDNIIPFRQKSLTDSDINSLFMGLVKLIKKTAMEEAMEKSKDAQQLLMKKMFSENAKKDKQIEMLKVEFEKLRKENQLLLQQIQTEKVDKKLALQRHLYKKREKESEENSKRV